MELDGRFVGEGAGGVKRGWGKRGEGEEGAAGVAETRAISSRLDNFQGAPPGYRRVMATPWERD